MTVAVKERRLCGRHDASQEESENLSWALRWQQRSTRPDGGRQRRALFSVPTRVTRMTKALTFLMLQSCQPVMYNSTCGHVRLPYWEKVKERDKNEGTLPTGIGRLGLITSPQAIS